MPFKIGQANLGVLIPLLILDLGGNAGAIGISSMLFSLVTIMATIVWGKFSDETDKRLPYILLGFIGVSACLLSIAFATSYVYVVLAYSALAFLMAAELPITPLFLLRSVRKDSWNDSFSKFNLICSWGLTMGLVLGGIFIMFFDSTITSLILALITFISVILIKVGLKELNTELNRSKLGIFPNHIIERKRFSPNFILHLPKIPRSSNVNNRNFFIVTILLFTGSNFFFIPIIPYLRHIGIADGPIFAVNISSFVATSLVYMQVSKGLRKKGCVGLLKNAILARLMILALMLVSLTFITEYKFLIVLVFFTMIGAIWPFIYSASVTFVSDSSSDNNGGSLMGMYNAVSTFGLMMGSMVAGYVFDIHSLELCIAISLAFYILAYAVLFRHVRIPGGVNVIQAGEVHQ